jgi:hypothetical protein
VDGQLADKHQAATLGMELKVGAATRLMVTGSVG